MSCAGRSLALFALLGFLSGCGSSNPNTPATISGTVTYKGTPLTGGNMMFHGNDVVYPASIGADGTYEGRDFPVGEMTVTIETESLDPALKSKPYPGKSKAGKDKMAEQFRPPPEGVTPAASTYVKIPAKYADKTKSGFTVTIKAGRQTQNFELTD